MQLPFKCLLRLLTVVFAVCCGNTVAEVLEAEASESKPLLRLAGPPWDPFLSERHPNQGLATEIVSQALNKAGYRSEVSIMPWRRVLAEAEYNAVDVLIGLWYSDVRSERFTFSMPYYVNQIHILHADDLKAEQFMGLDSLKGKRVGLRKGASFGSEFDQADYLNKVYVPGSISMLKMLLLNRIDYGVGDRLILSRLIANDKALQGRIKFLQPVLTQLPLHMAVVNTHPDKDRIVAQFNKALDRMKNNGDLLAIYRKFGIEGELGTLLSLE